MVEHVLEKGPDVFSPTRIGPLALRNRIGPPLRMRVLRRNLGRFAHCETFVEGLRKAGVPE